MKHNPRSNSSNALNTLIHGLYVNALCQNSAVSHVWNRVLQDSYIHLDSYIHVWPTAYYLLPTSLSISISISISHPYPYSYHICNSNLFNLFSFSKSNLIAHFMWACRSLAMVNTPHLIPNQAHCTSWKGDGGTKCNLWCTPLSEHAELQHNG